MIFFILYIYTHLGEYIEISTIFTISTILPHYTISSTVNQKLLFL